VTHHLFLTDSEPHSSGHDRSVRVEPKKKKPTPSAPASALDTKASRYDRRRSAQDHL